MDEHVRFADRADAGRWLASALKHVPQPAVVLGLPRGGVVVAAEVARSLHAPLDVIVVRKLGVPWMREVAMGAVGENGVLVLNQEVITNARVTDHELAQVKARECLELDRRVTRLRAGRPGPSLGGRTVVIVDDGIATGATARAAIAVARAQHPARVVLATPVAAWDVADALREVADEVVCLLTPPTMTAVGEHYLDFRPVSDEAVAGLLQSSLQHAPIA
jgi:predicted phosphoribosyltransferase